MLTSALEASPPELKSQIHYIIQQLHSDTPTSSVTSGNDSDDDETPPSDDSAEEEDEETDVIEGDEDEVTIATNLPAGESLLVKYTMT